MRNSIAIEFRISNTSGGRNRPFIVEREECRVGRIIRTCDINIVILLHDTDALRITILLAVTHARRTQQIASYDAMLLLDFIHRRCTA